MRLTIDLPDEAATARLGRALGGALRPGDVVALTGPLGAGHAMKTINNYIAALNLVSALQGLLVGKKYGLDPEQMVDIINASYGRNAATEFVLKQQVTSGKFAANFKMWLAAKDARGMAETARHVGFSAPLPQDVTALFAEAEKTLGRDGLCLGDVFRRIDVEERIDRLLRPVGNGDAVPRGPDFDLMQPLDLKRLAQVVA